MRDDPESWRAASLLLRWHGDEAALVAARRADELLAAGDAEGSDTWKRIHEAVAVLTRAKPAEGERVN